MTLLVHWLWQGTLVAALATLALRASPRMNAATRHAILWVAVATVVTLPLMWPGSVASPPAARDAEALAGGRVVLPAVPGWLVGAVAGAWFGWVLLGVARIAAGFRRLQRVRDEARPAPARLLADLPPWTRATGHEPLPDVRVTPAMRGACVIGFGRPTILLSADLVDSLDRGALGHVILHECAHLERGDHWSRLAQSLVGAVAGLHPAVAWLLQRIDLERELACDEHVVSRTRAAREYARSLVEAADVEARGRGRRLPALAPGAMRSRGGLRARVERLLEAPAARPSGVRGPALAASVAAALLSLGAAGAVAPAVVFADLLLAGPRAALAPLTARYLPSWPQPASDHADSDVASLLPRASRRTSARATAAAGVATTPATIGTRTLEPDAEVVVVLEGRTVSPELTVPPAPAGGASAPQTPAGTWSQAGAAGRAVGQAAGTTGGAIGDAAARAGSALGNGAKRAGVSLAGFFTGAF